MMRIRPTRPGDISLLPPIEVSAGQAFRTIPELAWIADDDVLSEAQHQQLLRVGYCWVATDDGDQPVGFLAARPCATTLHIEELAVAGDRQGQGIGRALMQHVVAVARRETFAQLSLTTFRDVAWNAPFYASLGFRMLDDSDMPELLGAILDQEAAHGFPPRSRCAMVLPLIDR